jgi:hypothetical protein
MSIKILIAKDEQELAEPLRDCIVEDGLFEATDIGLADNGAVLNSTEFY